MSKIKVDEDSIDNLINVVEDFQGKLEYRLRDQQTKNADNGIISNLRSERDQLQRDKTQLENWQKSTEGRATQERAAELDAKETELTKKRKEIEDLSYNKGYVAGYVEITQKLGKTS